MKIFELFYHDNIGAMEMFRFHQVATPEQKRRMSELLAQRNFKAAWEFLQLVTGLKLKS